MRKRKERTVGRHVCRAVFEYEGETLLNEDEVNIRVWFYIMRYERRVVIGAYKR